MTPSDLPTDLPGLNLILKGYQDLAKASVTDEALLITIYAPELTRLGLTLPNSETSPDSPAYLLYRSIEQKDPANAHSTYNALNRRVTSFIHCLDQLASAN